MEKINRPPKPDWFTSVEKDYDRILEEFKKANDSFRCAYTSVPIQISHISTLKRRAVIDRVKPISQFPELKNDWDNLLVVSAKAQENRKEKYDEKLLNPTDSDYDFDKYFEINFETFKILPKQNASSKDKKRAEITRDCFDLNNKDLVEMRELNSNHYLTLFYKRKEETKLKGKIFNINNYEELKFNKYLFPFLIKRAIKYIQKEENEFIDNIHIRKYLGVQDFLIKDVASKKEIYFLGENGDGKTLILQAIILAIHGLDDKFLYKYVSETVAKDFSIKLLDEKNNFYLYNNLITSINKNVLAYGVSRLNHSSKHSVKDRGYLTIFDCNAYLINPIDWLKEVERKELKGIGKLKLTTAIEVLQELLENRVEIKETEDGDYVFDERGTIVSFEQLSDGYRSTLLWLCDLLSRLASQQPEISALKDYKAIVLVDEIGAFLHPRWAISLVKKLRNLFPNIQWIFTTHSPIVTLGASEDAIFFRLYKENGITKVSEPFDEPLSMTANSLLTSMLWGLESFTTRAVKPQDVSSDDYVYQKIHQVISQKIQDMPALTDDDVLKMIEEEFEKIKDE